jgi:hypothetical protein
MAFQGVVGWSRVVTLALGAALPTLTLTLTAMMLTLQWTLGPAYRADRLQGSQVVQGRRGM